MPINKISSEVIDQNLENYIVKSIKAGYALSDLQITTYADAAGVNPVDGIGGTANIVASLNTVSPLSGDADLRLVKDASNRQGDGISIPFTIDNRHLGKVLQISFDMELISGNYENPIPVPVTGTYSITSTTCTVTAPHNFIQGQSVFMTFTSGTRPADGFYTITSVTATTFVFTVASGSSTGNCNYTTIGDLRVSIIQDPTGTPVMIEPVNTNLQLGITNQRIRHIASFQTHISITSYRLCIHVGSASTVAYTVDFANFKVWEPTQSIGSIITDWQSYSATINGVSVSSSSYRWRRSGGSVEISGSFTFSSQSGADFQIPLPSGLSISSIVDRKTILGKIHLAKASFDSSNPQWFLIGITGTSYLTLSLQSNNFNTLLSNFNSSGTGASSGDIFTFFASVPIQGWGSSVAMSSDSGEGRVVSATITGTLSTGASPTVNLTWSSPTILNDTHSAFNGTTGYTAPVSGFYQFNANFNTDSATGQAWNAWVSGSNRQSCGFAISGFVFISGIIFLLSGQNLTFRPNATGGNVGSVGSGNYFTISRVSASSQVIATAETVAMNALKSLGSVGNGVAITSWDIPALDTHTSFNNTLGEYTIPMSGVYFFSGQLSDNTPAQTMGISLQSNISGSFVSIVSNTMYVSSGSIYYSPHVTHIKRCIAGEKIRLYSSYSSGGTSGAWTSIYFNVARIGI